LEPAYEAKNGPIDDLTELLFIKGITPELYWGPNSTIIQLLRFKPGLRCAAGYYPTASPIPSASSTFSTAVSSGKININTASSTTLQMIPGVDATWRPPLFGCVPGQTEWTGPVMMCRCGSVGDLNNIGLNVQAITSLGQFLRVRSSTFEVQVDVEVGLSKRRYYALLRRNSARDVQILNFRWE